tara:strand:+ start:53934 stop:55253 length:1320 start_codon:yes stop_codon:yes gene_type:complete
MINLQNQLGKKMSEIKSIKARQIFDSRGYPTIEVEVELISGDKGIAAVPSGASTGSFEAHELRDNDKSKFSGKGVLKAVRLVNSEINETLTGFDSKNQKSLDSTLTELDGTKNKSRLGANSILGVSLANARAASNFLKIPLYKYVGGIHNSLPTPMINIINGGCHANNDLDFQEFMIIPLNFTSFRKALNASSEIFHLLKNNLNSKGLSTSVGDEGGFSPNLKSNRECLDLIVKSVEDSNYKIGKDIFLGLDVASSEFFKNNKYLLKGEGLSLRSDELIKYYEELIRNYPIISIEDGISEDDWEGWKNLSQQIGKKCQLVGDDLFVTNVERLTKGIEMGCGNAILIKLNQIGTLSETLETINLAKANSYNTIISHRSGETEDTFIADLSVGVSAGQIKTGSMSRSERISKYNQILRIEEIDFDNLKYSANMPFSFLNIK